MRNGLFVFIGVVIALSGCATKRFTRLPPLSASEASLYTCRELALEKAKTVATMEQNRREAGINAASVMGFLGDFGIGNANEKHTADRIVAERYHQIEQAEAAKGCLAQAATAPDAGVPLQSGLPAKYPANTASGYCLVVPPGYRGTNDPTGPKPVVTAGTPICPNNQPPAPR